MSTIATLNVNLKARRAADLRGRSPVGCNRMLGATTRERETTSAPQTVPYPCLARPAHSLDDRPEHLHPCSTGRWNTGFLGIP